jgi:hypothetical protein
MRPLAVTLFTPALLAIVCISGRASDRFSLALDPQEDDATSEDGSADIVPRSQLLSVSVAPSLWRAVTPH